MKENLQKIRKACIKANPAIVEQVFLMEIPRSIHLADVLLAISSQGNSCDYFLSRNGQGMFAIMSQDNIGDKCYWNLFDDNLEHQLEKTINFIASLL